MQSLPDYLIDPTAIVPVAESGFSTTISALDRGRLHQILRKVHLRSFPAEWITDYECDKLLDAWGPAVAQTLVKAAVDAQFV